MDRSQQIAWKKLEEMVINCFSVACLNYGVTAVFCPLPRDLNEEELDFMMADYMSNKFMMTHELGEVSLMTAYIKFVKGQVSDFNQFGVPF